MMMTNKTFRRALTGLLLGVLFLSISACDSMNASDNEAAVTEVEDLYNALSSELNLTSTQQAQLSASLAAHKGDDGTPGYLWIVADSLSRTLTDEQIAELISRTEGHEGSDAFRGLHGFVGSGGYYGLGGFWGGSRRHGVSPVDSVLGLTEEQQEQLQAIHENYREQIRALREARRDSTISEEDFLRQMLALHEALEAEALAVLTAEQRAALQTRAYLARGGDHYLCPLAKAQCPEAQLAAYLATTAGETPLVITDRAGHPVADAFECAETLTAAVEGQTLTWTERRLVVRSRSQAEAATKRLYERLAAAEAQLAQLNGRGRGKKQDKDRAAFEARVAAIVKRHHVEDLLAVRCREQIDERAVRAYGNRPARIERRPRFEVYFERCQTALDEHLARLAWRVYATNHAGLTLSEAVWAYRGQYVLERSFGRLKGQPLSLTPMYLQREDHATGLVRLLSLALRVLILLEFVARRQLAVEQASLAGLYAGNPKRATARPTAERLLSGLQGGHADGGGACGRSALSSDGVDGSPAADLVLVGLQRGGLHSALQRIC